MLFSVAVVYYFSFTSIYFAIVHGKKANNKIPKVEVLADTHSIIGEGPHWDIEKQSLYFVDIEGASIHRYDDKENKVYHCKVANEKFVSFIIPVEGTSDKFAAGIGSKVAIVNWDGRSSDNCKIEKVLFHVETNPKLTDNRLNDAKADPKGRLYFGSMQLKNPTEHKTGSLYMYVKDKPVKQIASKIGISNGLTWNPKTQSMFYIDSVAYNVTKYHYDIETGDISNPKVLIDFRPKQGGIPHFEPDGMTIDKDGFLYVATYGGSKILKINPESGIIESEIEFPCEQITSAAFGGANLDILFVTTSSKGNKPAPAGSVFKVTGLGTVGLPMSKVVV